MTTKRTPSVAYLQQALREKTREVDVLHRISTSISNQLDLEAILKHIVEVVVEVTNADACLLYLLSDSQDELILRASKNPHPKLIGRITIGLGKTAVKSTGNIDAATSVGKMIAEKSKAAGVEKVAFDRSGFKYHGRVKALADAAREAGLQF